MESVDLPPHLQGKVSTVIVPESAMNGGELDEDGEEAASIKLPIDHALPLFSRVVLKPRAKAEADITLSLPAEYRD